MLAKGLAIPTNSQELKELQKLLSLRKILRGLSTFEFTQYQNYLKDDFSKNRPSSVKNF